MSHVKVIALEAAENIDAAWIGQKAVGLIRMSRMGLPVPPAFCITEAAFRQHLEANDLVGRIETALGNLHKQSPEAEEPLLLDVRAAIVAAPFSCDLRNQVEHHYRALGAGLVAVRSSATAEDLPGHSFAGLYDSYLGVGDLEDCIDAVKRCWASLWTQRAYEYRQKNGFDHLRVSMAVIVQKLVRADTSGVLFTADPVTGRSNRIIVEARYGLGSALVSGKVTPDRFVVDKRKLNILSHSVSEKRIQHSLGEHDSVKEQPVPDERASVASIDERTIRKLAKFAKKAEAEFGCPQDMEWAVCGHQIFLLQSRPITALPLARSWEDRQVWTNANTGEVLPDVITPFTWLLIRVLLNEIFDRTLGLIAVSRGDRPLFDRVAGRVYFNLNTLAGVLKCLPVLRDLDLDKFFGGEHQRLYNLGQLDISDEDVPDLEFSLPRMIVLAPGLLFRITTYTPAKGERMVARLASEIDRLQDLDVNAMSEDQIAECLRTGINDLRRWLADLCHGAIYALIGFAAFPILDRVCRKWFGEKGATLANRLLAGIGDMQSARAGHDLWRLAQQGHEIAGVENVVLAGNNWQKTGEKISGLQRGNEFLKAWDQFMACHGHHCRGEMELFNARWAETPDYILGIVRSYIGCIGQTDPLEDYTERTQQRRQLQRQCRRRLKNPLKQCVFNYLLTHAQRGLTIRENSKSLFARLLAVWRKMLIELGNRLAAKGVLKTADEIFFLEFQELEPVTKGRADFDVRRVIASRWAEYEKNKSITPPKVVIGKFSPDNFTPDILDTDAEVLQGLAVSAGVVTGKARVILRADTHQHLSAGEILVAPFTDPGWTPYFVPAAAIVMDEGGLLSHGSIIAREYGIPAVVNVGSATKIIKTGRTIQVDGNRGLVRLL